MYQKSLTMHDKIHTWEDRAWEEYLYWQTQDKKTLVIRDIQRDPAGGMGKIERLRGNLSGWWSRRIDEVNRVVYYEQDGIIPIASCCGHYEK